MEYDPFTHENLSGARDRLIWPATHTAILYDKAGDLSLEDDFLGLDSETVLPVKEFSAKRRSLPTKDKMNRLYAVESQSFADRHECRSPAPPAFDGDTRLSPRI